MQSDMVSAEKVASLRMLAGSTVPEARLRAVLVRAGGNLDSAANVLFDDGLLGNQSAPIQMPAAQSQSQRPTLAPQSKEQEKPSDRGSENAKSAQKNRKASREEWAEFYRANYLVAITAVGKDKAEIYKFIKQRWREMHAARRKENLKSDTLQAQSEQHGSKTSAANTPNSLVGTKAKECNENITTAASEIPKPLGLDTTSTTIQGANLPFSTFGLKLSAQVRKRERHGPECQGGLTNGNGAVAGTNTLKGSASETEWPKKIDSRVCTGFMLTGKNSGKNLLSTGDIVTLEGSKLMTTLSNSRGKRVSAPSAPSRIVRFVRKDREMGRLCANVSASLGPALQSGFVFAEGKIILAPKKARIHAEVVMDLSIYVTKDAFEGEAAQKAAEAGMPGVDSTENEQAASAMEKGIDARRIHVINLVSNLKLCEPPEPQDTMFPVARATTEAEDAGTVAEEHAEAYYRTVDEIDEQDAKAFQPPKHLLSTLREYQRAGVGWMVAREKLGSLANSSGVNSDFMMNPLWKKRVFPNGGAFFMNPTTGGLSLNAPLENAGGPYGGILADEMGLGKTIQCIACIVHDIEEQRNKLNSEGREVQAGEKKYVRKPSALCVSSEDSDSDTEEPDFGAEETEGDLEHDEIDEISRVGNNTANSKISIVSDAAPFKADVRKPPSRRSARRRTRIEPNYNEQDSNDDCEIVEDLEKNRPGMDGGCPDDDISKRSNRECEEINDTEKQWKEWRSKKSKTSKQVENKTETDDDDWFEQPQKRRRVSRNTRSPAVKSSKSALKKLMVSARSGRQDRGGTLIVCPTSLLTQWINELHDHVAPQFLRAVTHYGVSRGDSLSISLQYADVVVTTYGIIASECPDESSEKADSKSVRMQGGPVFQLQWHRVILDEAHTIKSRVTKWARAAFRLQAEKRWCVTGTVIHNHVNDVFSLLHFLRVKPWSSWALWNRGIVLGMESKDVAAQKASMSLLRDIISSMTLRRKKSTKDSRGRQIIHLPKKTVEIVSLIPSPEERDFYTALHDRTKTQFDTFVREGKVMRNYASILELLLRLRQACDHPYLVFAAAPSKDSVVMKDKDKLFKQFLQAGSSSQFVEKIFNDAESGSLHASKECPLCLDVIDDAVAPRECGHPACRTCLLECVQRTKRCPVCRASITFDSVATLPRATRFSVDLKTRWRSSAKIDALLKDLAEVESRRVRNGREGVGKTVVFSQFTSMLDLVGMALEKAKIRALRIDGSVPQAQRAVILERFENEDEVASSTANVLLVSLRAGGVGLNLCAASHAILLDIHWNPQVDAQAQDRVHRHGQTRDVIIKRYIVNGSVEERLLKVQERKQDIADGALDVATDEDKKQARMTELKLLFAEV